MIAPVGAGARWPAIALLVIGLVAVLAPVPARAQVSPPPPEVLPPPDAPSTGVAPIVDPAASCAVQPRTPSTLRIVSLPPVPGVRYTLDGRPFESGGVGVAEIQTDCLLEVRSRLQVLNREVPLGDRARARFARFYGGAGNLTATFDIDYRVSFSFSDVDGKRVKPDRLTSFSVKGSTGAVKSFADSRPQWLHGTRVIPSNDGLLVKKIYYTIEKVIVDGSNVVNRSQQRFLPTDQAKMNVALLFFTANFRTRDAFFNFPIGSAIRLTTPSGKVERHKIPENGRLTLRSLARGDYHVIVEAPGLKIARPVAVSRNQEVDLKVFSWLDVALLVFVLAAISFGLIVVRRPSLRRLPSIRRAERGRPGLASEAGEEDGGEAVPASAVTDRRDSRSQPVSTGVVPAPDCRRRFARRRRCRWAYGRRRRGTTRGGLRQAKQRSGVHALAGLDQSPNENGSP